jgi:ATP-dependent Clp protease ATP-binding subunit ClpA
VLIEVFERFTDQARRAVVMAQEESRMLEHNCIDTEHLLLGLAHEGEGVAAKALESMGISLQVVRQQVIEMVGEVKTQRTGGHIPFTPRAKKAIELSLREANDLGHSYIGTEHLLLGLVREGEGVAAQVLIKLGADRARVREEVVRLLHDGTASNPVSEGSRLGRRGRGRQVDDALTRIDSLESRLAAIERWVGMAPGVDDIDDRIAQVRREKEAAIDAQDFETAAALRDRERRLLASKSSRVEEWADGAATRRSLAEELGKLTAELERLRAALREHGIEPGTEAG